MLQICKILLQYKINKGSINTRGFGFLPKQAGRGDIRRQAEVGPLFSGRKVFFPAIAAKGLPFRRRTKRNWEMVAISSDLISLTNLLWYHPFVLNL